MHTLALKVSARGALVLVKTKSFTIHLTESVASRIDISIAPAGLLLLHGQPRAQDIQGVSG